MLRRGEQGQMNDYVALDCGHMEYLISALDGDPAGYVVPGLAALPVAVDAGLLLTAPLIAHCEAHFGQGLSKPVRYQAVKGADRLL